MSPFRFVTSTVLVTCLTASAANAQERVVAARGTAVAPVTISATRQGVRVAALGPVSQTRLEVFAPSGETVYSSGFRAGGVRDWVTRGAQTPALPDGSYLCVLTLRDLSGRVFVRQGNILLRGGEASLHLAEPEPAAAAGEEDSLTRVGDGAGSAVTAHDGRDGHLVSTSGDLTLRTGDFFSGRDVERVRVTSDGRVGIGTDRPEATLDVAGAVRASGGFRFPDGTTLTSKGGRLSLTSAEGDEIPGPNAAGTGTQNRLAKWAETGGAGTLTDSTFLEDASGNVFNFTGTRAVGPGQQPFFEAQRGSSADILQRFWNTGAGGAKLRYVAGAGATSQIQLTDANEWLASIASSTGIGLQLRVRPWYAPNSEAALDASALITLTRDGLVGINTSTPGTTLDVAGTIKASRQYNLGGNRVLILSGPDALPYSNLLVGPDTGHFNMSGVKNIFVGVSAGSSNTEGIENSFFGYTAGYNNTKGSSNSFFGIRAGVAHTEGNNNTFLGKDAGQFHATGTGNTLIGASAGAGSGLTNATAIGYHAEVTQSNSLVLGTVGTNVGIGTPSPGAKLHVLGGDAAITTLGTGLILRATDGAVCYRLTVNSAGQLSTAGVSCPP